VHAAARRSSGDLPLGGTLSRAGLLELPTPLRRRALWRLLVEGTGRAPSAPLLGLLLSDLAGGRTTRRSLPGGWSLHLRSSLLHLEPDARAAAPAGNATPEAATGQLEWSFAEAPTAAPGSTGAQRLDLPGLVTLSDRRQILAEIVYLPRGTDVLRAGTSVEIDASEFVAEPPWTAPTLWVRFRARGPLPCARGPGEQGPLALPRRRGRPRARAARASLSSSPATSSCGSPASGRANPVASGPTPRRACA
jgi:hypothetical protein